MSLEHSKYNKWLDRKGEWERSREREGERVGGMKGREEKRKEEVRVRRERGKGREGRKRVEKE